ncbi:MAG TPA: hypothetical protein VGO36_07450 [Solirubrobacterales bacterium]|jgi:hypothetical protein|nr:hypothetical protein [Solirubrobacterales bacterium]
MKLLVRFSFLIALVAATCAMPVSAAEATTLFGTTSVEGSGDSLTGTHSEAFRYESSLAGTATGVSIYLTSSTGAKVALYAESGGKPGTRLATGEVSTNTAKTWVSIPLASSVAIAKGAHYWIALAPKGSKIIFRTHALSGETDYEGSGFANPWSTIETYTDGPMSAYVTGEETKGFTCPKGSLTPNEKGFVEITTSNQLVCGQEVKEITIAPGVEGTVIEHNFISGGGNGINAGSVNCSIPNGPVYEGCTSTPAFTNTLIAYNEFKGPFGEDPIHTNNFKDLTIERNWLHDFEETGNHTDAWQNVWGGEDAVFSHNVISDFVGEGTLLKDGDVTNVKYENNLMIESGTNEAAPFGEAELQTIGVHGIELIHNTFEGGTGENIRVETTGAIAKYNVFDNLTILEGGELTESQNNLDVEPWSFFPSETDVFGTPTYNADWQTTKKAQDGTTLGIQFPASEVIEEAGP